MRKLSRLELQVMEMLWNRGPLSIREIQESFPERGRPAYTTIQTIVYRLEEKQACLLYTSPSPRDGLLSRMPSSA